MDYHEEMDYQLCNQVWQRVAPELDPYPEVRSAAAEPAGESCRLQKGMMPMEQLRMAIEGELTARRAYLAHARCAGGSVGRTLMQMAEEDGRHACRLKSLYYLLTGECWGSERGCGCVGETMSLCRFLRQRYQMETTAADRYESWADGMEDECMASMLRQLAEDDRCHAATVMRLLENRLS